MAAVVEKEVLGHDYPVAGDMSAYLHHFMKDDGSGNATVCTADTDDPIGVLMNDDCTAAGKTAHIMMVGICPIVSAAALSLGNRVGPDASGHGEAKTIGTHTTKYIPGKVIAASSGASAKALIILDVMAGRAS